jgi:hypothetical protein
LCRDIRAIGLADNVEAAADPRLVPPRQVHTYTIGSWARPWQAFPSPARLHPFDVRATDRNKRPRLAVGQTTGDVKRDDVVAKRRF